jgi:hypothetical protein
MREPWWNTSEGLKHHYPAIATAGWKAFASTYDTTEARDYRLKAWRATKPKMPEASRSPEQLEDLARGVLGSMNARLLFSQKPLSQEECAEKLAKIVLRLVTQQEPEFLRELLRAVEARNTHPPDPRNIVDALQALRRFIHREGRLPGKTDLNIEANRILWSRRFDRHQCPGSEQRFGGRYSHEGQKLRVVDVVSERIHACPSHRWDTPRWDPSTFSSQIVKPGGLSGLHRSKRS